MRPKKRSPLLKLTVLLELASHASMGVAFGLTFALILTLAPAFGVSDNYRLPAFHDRHDRVGRAQIDTNDLTHIPVTPLFITGVA